MNDSKNDVIVFGESGSGKSSLVNLLLGQKRAAVSDKAVGCTFNFQKYETPNFNLYDTVGLSEGANGTVRPDLAVKELIYLLKSLKHGVSLLIFVIEKGRIKKSLHKNYNLFVDVLCMKNVPVILVITHCEMETIQGQWWRENKQHFEQYGMSFKSVISGSALQPKSAPEIIRPIVEDLNRRTVADLLKAIDTYMLDTSWQFKGGWANWFYAICKKVADMIGNAVSLKLESAAVACEKRLTEYFQSQGYNKVQADEMAQDVASEMTVDEDED